MKKIYTITTRMYDSRAVSTFEKRKEWEDALDRESLNGGRGKGESFEVAIYDIDDTQELHVDNERCTVWHPASRDRRASIDTVSVTDDEGEMVEMYPSQTDSIAYYSIEEIEDEDDDDKNGKWRDEIGEVYDTWEEAVEMTSPAQYLYI